jgi:hypothetical protein
MNFEDVDIVLVPFDDLAVLHRRRLDRHEIVQRSRVSTKPPDAG